MNSQSADFTSQALEHILHLSEKIGGRGSCTEYERLAAEYVDGELKALGVESVRTEPFRAIPATYWPYALGFGAALVGSIFALVVGGQPTFLLASLLNLLGTWAMLAETEFSNHWARWLLPRASSQNITGVIPPKAATRNRAVLCAHLDTHRTPLFYSSQTWYSIFSLLLTLTFLSMLVGALAFFTGALMGWAAAKWVGMFSAPIQAFALSMCLHADFTPYSPGANDNASGVGVILGLVRRLLEERLSNTEIHLAFTGCEEVGTYGIQSYLDDHSQALGPQAVYIILDEVGLGRLKYLSADGLVLKHKTHPRALELARQAGAAHPQVPVVERIGLAYTDALSATKRGLIALTLCDEPDPETGAVSHWHQMSDTIETLQPATLGYAHDFVWEILQRIDEPFNER